MYCLSAFLGILCFSRYLTAGSGQNCSNDGDIRLAGGPNGTVLEGRVEICQGNQWGAICNDRWDNVDASVVCRQLGLSVEGSRALTYLRHPENVTHLDEVTCMGNEQILKDCPANMIPQCNSPADAAGVNCRPNFPQNVTISATDTSVLITWQHRGVTRPDHYNITLEYISNSGSSNQTHISTIQVLGSDTALQYGQLIPQQKYNYCISSIYGSELASFCHNFETKTLSASGGNRYATTIGILSSMTVILFLLLMLVGIGGLTYPRCIRPRIKDKRYLSRVSDFMDDKIYCNNNSEAYVPDVHPKTTNPAAVPPMKTTNPAVPPKKTTNPAVPPKKTKNPAVPPKKTRKPATLPKNTTNPAVAPTKAKKPAALPRNTLPRSAKEEDEHSINSYEMMDNLPPIPGHYSMLYEAMEPSPYIDSH